MSACPNCGKFKPEPLKPYSYSGPVCACGFSPVWNPPPPPPPLLSAVDIERIAQRVAEILREQNMEQSDDR
jgi:hypothetical protein